MTPEQAICDCIFAKIRNERQRVLDGRIHSAHYVRYTDMLNRCYNKKHKHHESYGGRGILVCQQWVNDFYLFNKNISDGFNRNLSLDRIENNKGYCPHNFRWATKQKQVMNQRKNPSRGIRLRQGSYRVFISIGEKQIHHGSYKTKEEAVYHRDLIYGEWYGKQ